MKIYEVNGGPFEDRVFFRNKTLAVKEAKELGNEHTYVNEHDIGSVTKDVICKLASGRGFSKSHKQVWPAK